MPVETPMRSATSTPAIRMSVGGAERSKGGLRLAPFKVGPAPRAESGGSRKPMTAERLSRLTPYKPFGTPHVDKGPQIASLPRTKVEAAPIIASPIEKAKPVATRRVTLQPKSLKYGEKMQYLSSFPPATERRRLTQPSKKQTGDNKKDIPITFLAKPKQEAVRRVPVETRKPTAERKPQVIFEKPRVHVPEQITPRVVETVMPQMKKETATTQATTTKPTTEQKLAAVRAELAHMQGEQTKPVTAKQDQEAPTTAVVEKQPARVIESTPRHTETLPQAMHTTTEHKLSAVRAELQRLTKHQEAKQAAVTVKPEKAVDKKPLTKAKNESQTKMKQQIKEKAEEIKVKIKTKVQEAEKKMFVRDSVTNIKRIAIVVGAAWKSFLSTEQKQVEGKELAEALLTKAQEPGLQSEIVRQPIAEQKEATQVDGSLTKLAKALAQEGRLHSLFEVGLRMLTLVGKTTAVKVEKKGDPVTREDVQTVLGTVPNLNPKELSH